MEVSDFLLGSPTKIAPRRRTDRGIRWLMRFVHVIVTDLSRETINHKRVRFRFKFMNDCRWLWFGWMFGWQRFARNLFRWRLVVMWFVEMVIKIILRTFASLGIKNISVLLKINLLYVFKYITIITFCKHMWNIESNLN